MIEVSIIFGSTKYEFHEIFLYITTNLYHEKKSRNTFEYRFIYLLLKMDLIKTRLF